MAGNNQRIPKFSIGIDMEMIERFEKLSPELDKLQVPHPWLKRPNNFVEK